MTSEINYKENCIFPIKCIDKYINITFKNSLDKDRNMPKGFLVIVIMWNMI